MSEAIGIRDDGKGNVFNLLERKQAWLLWIPVCLHLLCYTIRTFNRQSFSMHMSSRASSHMFYLPRFPGPRRAAFV